jgi:hypothetical protein
MQKVRAETLFENALSKKHFVGVGGMVSAKPLSPARVENEFFLTLLSAVSIMRSENSS